MNSKISLLLSLITLVAGTIINIVLSANLHYLLLKKMTIIKFVPFTESMKSIVSDQQHLALFLCFEGFVALASIYLIAMNSKPYQSNLRAITPNISTPVPAGQKQFGSAEWLTDKEKDRAFNTYVLKKNHSLIKNLIKSGDEDLKNGGIDRAYEKKETFSKTLKSKADSKTTNETKENNAQEKAYMSKGGVVLGLKKERGNEKIYFEGDDVHTLCIGATRSGKSRTVVLQSIGTLALAGESMVLTDPKGELYQYTYPFLERMGFEVVCIDFKNPLKSQRYNFLQPVIDAVDADDISKAVEATWDLTSHLVGEPNGERIWRDGEASIIASSIMSVVYDNKEKANKKYQNMTNVYYFIGEMCRTINGKMPILEYVKKLSPSHPARALLAISEVAPSKTRGSFYTAALTTLRLFTNPLINSMTNASDYDVTDIGKKKMAVFITLPDEKTTYYSLASLLVSQHYELLVKAADERGGRLLNRVNFICDEFGNFTKIPDFATKLTVGGGRGIRFNLYLQSFAQLDEKYGKETSKTIKGNCENWIYLQADDLETLDEISKKLGNYTVSTYTLSASHARFTTPSSSHSINLTARALLTVDEVRLISRPFSLITSRNNPVMMYAPDLSEWTFNRIYGLGDKEHNRKVREARENIRQKRTAKISEMDLWNIWTYYAAICEDQSIQRPSVYNMG
ncbi:VirD4-like conjugal transfer protein, CD1115 family [Desulfitibacter alkalitolerans]|uniref:VirD4-like conjugal transfer protein, CD1115 family n=1 Tax=Desulfitibacter alkalitolerans TaxID=264641 RepID=UPI000684A533|nr:type IV secretory system conjugative DNA transfer family protein [Desulfitibacter alkalitolerans]